MASIKVDKVIINSGAAIEILNSEGAQELCLTAANGVASRGMGNGGGPYTVDVQPGRTRAHALIKVDDIHARHMEHNYNCLLKGL